MSLIYYYVVWGDRAGAGVLAVTYALHDNSSKYHLNVLIPAGVKGSVFQSSQEGGARQPRDWSLGKDGRRFAEEQCTGQCWALNLIVSMRNAVKKP